MKATIVIAGVAAGVVALAGAGAIGAGVAWRLAHDSGEAADAPDAAADAGPEPVAAVTTTAAAAGPLPRHLTLYGQVVALEGAGSVVAAPCDGVVTAVMAMPGMDIAVGATVAVMAPSREAREQVAEAVQALSAAQADRERSRSRLSLQLATAQDDAAAQQAVDAAQLHLANLQTRLDRAGAVIAQVAGIVGEVSVKPGQVVTEGTALLGIVPESAREARLGCPVGVAAGLARGAPVTVTAIRAPGEPETTMSGVIRAIPRSVDADGLVPVAVSLPATGGAVLGEALRGEIALDSAEGVVVPEAALVATDDGWSVYTVAGGGAHEHPVEVIAHDGGQAVVVERAEAPDAAATAAAPRGADSTGAADAHPGTAKDMAHVLAVGDRVVIAGNLQVSDGMAVSEGAHDDGASPEPSGSATPSAKPSGP